MPRFICVVGEDATIYTTDDQLKVQSYSDEDYFAAFDNVTGMVYVGGNQEGNEVFELPELQMEDEVDNEDGGED